MTHKTYPDKMDHRQVIYRHIGFKNGERSKPIWICQCSLIFIAEDPRSHYHRVKREKRE